MPMNSPAPDSMDAYIQSFPAEIQAKLQAIRAAILAAVPDATEKISWQMPTFYRKGNLVHFAVHQHHIGLYPGASGIEHFQAEFAARGYPSSKGAVQFPLREQPPLELIARIAAFRAAENDRLADERLAAQQSRRTKH